MHVFEQLEWVMGCNKLAIYTEARRTMPPHSRLFQILSAALHVRILYSKILRRSHSIPNTGRGAKTRSFFPRIHAGMPKSAPPATAERPQEPLFIPRSLPSGRSAGEHAVQQPPRTCSNTPQTRRDHVHGGPPLDGSVEPSAADWSAQGAAPQARP